MAWRGDADLVTQPPYRRSDIVADTFDKIDVLIHLADFGREFDEHVPDDFDIFAELSDFFAEFGDIIASWLLLWLHVG